MCMIVFFWFKQGTKFKNVRWFQCQFTNVSFQKLDFSANSLVFLGREFALNRVYMEQTLAREFALILHRIDPRTQIRNRR